MATAPLPTGPRPELLARGAQGLGLSLIVLFLLTILGNFLPPRLLDPAWYLTLSSNLIDNGVNPFVGLFMIMLASYLNPSNPATVQRQARFRSLACWAAIAYLLLAPLQALAFLRGFDQASSSLVRQTQQSRQAIASLRDAVVDADTLADLQTRLRKLQAPTLPSDAASVPLAALKTSLLDQLEGRDNVLKQSLREPLVKQLWPTLQKTLRYMVAAVVLGLGFASVGTPKGSPVSLLQSWIESLRALKNQGIRIQSHWKQWIKKYSTRRTMAQKTSLIRLSQKKQILKNQRKEAERKRALSKTHKEHFNRINKDDKRQG